MNKSDFSSPVFDVLYNCCSDKERLEKYAIENTHEQNDEPLEYGYVPVWPFLQCMCGDFNFQNKIDGCSTQKDIRDYVEWLNGYLTERELMLKFLQETIDKILEK